MILIADSGSTKTAWALAGKSHEVPIVYTGGLNPYFVDEATIIATINTEVLPRLKNIPIVSVYFYGSGCARPAKAAMVKGSLGKVFKEATVNVESDLLGNARALFGTKKGIACILGTGSGSGLYNGQIFTQSLPGLGFILGDEGSGAHLGKLLLASWMKNELPENIHADFETRYGSDSAALLDKVYNQPKPNTWLATLCSFIASHIESAFMDDLVCRSFQMFYDENILKYRDAVKLPVGFAGSVALIFRSQLEKIMAKNGSHIAGITDTPILGLIKYHEQ